MKEDKHDEYGTNESHDKEEYREEDTAQLTLIGVFLAYHRLGYIPSHIETGEQCSTRHEVLGGEIIEEIHYGHAQDGESLTCAY